MRSKNKKSQSPGGWSGFKKRMNDLFSGKYRESFRGQNDDFERDEKELLKEVYEKSRQIEISTRKLVNDIFGGEYHSSFRGQGMEFDRVREYVEGDDIRLIDWNVTARMNSPYVKIFQEERELTVILLVDASSSGAFGTKGRYKKELVAELCALIASSAIKNKDKVGLLIFTDVIEKFIRPQKGTAHILQIIREVLRNRPEHSKTDISVALKELNRVIKRRSIVFLISDFMSKDYLKSLQIANHIHDMIAVKIADPREQNFEDVGIIELQDSETGEVIAVDTGSNAFRKDYKAKASEDIHNLENEFSRMGLTFVNIKTNEPYEIYLVRALKERGRRRQL